MDPMLLNIYLCELYMNITFFFHSTENIYQFVYISVFLFSLDCFSIWCNTCQADPRLVDKYKVEIFYITLTVICSIYYLNFICLYVRHILYLALYYKVHPYKFLFRMSSGLSDIFFLLYILMLLTVAIIKEIHNSKCIIILAIT